MNVLASSTTLFTRYLWTMLNYTLDLTNDSDLEDRDDTVWSHSIDAFSWSTSFTCSSLCFTSISDASSVYLYYYDNFHEVLLVKIRMYVFETNKQFFIQVLLWFIQCIEVLWIDSFDSVIQGICGVLAVSLGEGGLLLSVSFCTTPQMRSGLSLAATFTGSQASSSKDGIIQ